MQIPSHFRVALGLCSRRQLVAMAGLMVATGLTDGIGLAILVPLVESLFPQGGDAGWALRILDRTGLPAVPETILILFLVIIGLRVALQHARDLMSQQLQLDATNRLRKRCLSAVLRAELHWLSARQHGTLITLLTNEVQRIGGGLQSLLGFFSSAVSIAAFLGVALVLSPGLTGLSVALGAVIFLILAPLRRRARALGGRQSRDSAALLGAVRDALHGLRVTRSLDAENRMEDALSQRIDTLRATFFAHQHGMTRARTISNLMGALGLSVFLWVGFRLVEAEPAVLLALIVVFARVSTSLGQMQGQLSIWLHTVPLIEELDALTRDAVRHAMPPWLAKTNRIELRSALSLSGVVVAGDTDRPRLSIPALTLPARSATLIVGPSGAGKSTLADIVSGLYLPESGEIRIDGNALTANLRRSWIQSVAYVPQDVVLFHGTVRDNLLWGRDRDIAEINRALDKAEAGFLRDLPDGLDTVIGEAGARLSGGERQRLALARGLLHHATLFIFDEVTSALDPERGSLVAKRLSALTDATVLIVSHRDRDVFGADRVLYLDGGRIVADSAPTPAAAPEILA